MVVAGVADQPTEAAPWISTGRVPAKLLDDVPRQGSVPALHGCLQRTETLRYEPVEEIAGGVAAVECRAHGMLRLHASGQDLDSRGVPVLPAMGGVLGREGYRGGGEKGVRYSDFRPRFALSCWVSALPTQRCSWLPPCESLRSSAHDSPSRVGCRLCRRSAVRGSRRASRFAPLPASATNKNGRVFTLPPLFVAPHRPPSKNQPGHRPILHPATRKSSVQEGVEANAGGQEQGEEGRRPACCAADSEAGDELAGGDRFR